MSGSVAEERIRAKAEAAMRLRWPEARIIHELQLEQGVCRIDLAAVTPDLLVVAEIKSERDVLKRLEKQLCRAVEVADEVWLCVAEKHEPALHDLRSWSSADNPALRRALRRTRVLVERADGGLHVDSWSLPSRLSDLPADPRARFDLLWAGEMTAVLRPYGGGGSTRGNMVRQAVESLTGAQIRRAVCDQLLSRGFPRADEPRARAIQSTSNLFRRSA